VQAIINLQQIAQQPDNVDEALQYVAREVVMADLMLPSWHVGWEQLYDNLKLQFESTRQIKASLRDINIATDGKLACLTMQVHADIILKDGSPFHITFREFDSFRKSARRWLVTQSHVYYPIDPTTGQAMINADLPVRGPVQWSEDPLPGPAVSNEQAKIELRNWLDSRSSATDVDVLMTHFGPGGDVIAFSPYAPGQYRGLQEIRDYLAQMLANVRAIEATVTDFVVATNGLMAGTLARQDVRISMRDGKTREVTIRQSNCLRRSGNRWYSVFEAISFAPSDQHEGNPIVLLEQTETVG
jgi:ketosteroid isomerase-like protein